MSNHRDWMTLSEAADHLGVATSTVRKWADAEKLPSFRTPGGHRRFYKEELDRFLGHVDQEPCGVNGRKAEIMVVDDDKLVRQIIREVFENEGFVVHEASSARDGILKMNRRLPDLLLLDVSMPGMDGWTMLQKVREKLDVDKLPVIMFSGVIDHVELQRAKVRGAQAYVRKPFDPLKMAQQARAILELHRA